MNRHLREIKTHGTPSFPFICYKFLEDTNKVFVSPHWHEEIEIIYIKKGTLYLTINNESFIGKENDIFIINTEELHEMHTEDNPVLYYAFLFSMSMLSFKPEDTVENNYIKPIMSKNLLFLNNLSYNNIIKSEIIAILDQIMELNVEKNTAFELGSKAMLLQVIYILIYKEFTKKSSIQATNSQKIQLQKDIIHYIRTNYMQNISLNQISTTFHMTPKYFCKYFKLNFNKTFIEYVNYIRIEHAMELLVNTDLSITEISISSGFDNFSYFIRRFKALTGCTPSQYRKTGTTLLTLI